MSVKNVLDITTNLIGTIGDKIQSIYNFFDAFINRPIGLANVRGKNYAIMLATLSRNIGDIAQSSQERYSTPIGVFSNPERNMEFTPWFHLDIEKRKYYDYIDYANNVFFDGRKDLVGSYSNGVRYITPNELNLENTKPGVIHAITDFGFNTVLSNSNVDFSIINPNRYGAVGHDTRLGVISNYFLSNTLENALNFQEEQGYSFTQEPKDNMNNASTESKTGKSSGASITKGIYSDFGYKGNYGISGNSFNTLLANPSVKNKFGGQIIPWSTSDHRYVSYDITNDLQRVADIHDASESDVVLTYLDKAEKSTLSGNYYPFGNYYSITYSLGLIANSGKDTQRFIAASMLGYPLSTEVDMSELLQSTDISVPTSMEGKKYYVGNGTRGTNYIDKMTGSKVEFIKHVTAEMAKDGIQTQGHIVRLQFPDAGNDNLWAANTIYQHIEAEGATVGSPLNTQGNTKFNLGVQFGSYKLYDNAIIGTKNDIINKTNQLFQTNKIKTIIARFHTDEIGTTLDARAKKDLLATAISKYGMSRGRNLLKSNTSTAKKDGNGYSNPYCRVWTFHHEYSTLKDAIRPFTGTDDDPLASSAVVKFRSKNSGFDSGQKRLSTLSARHRGNRLVQIAPTKDSTEAYKDQLKHLMFSIENLAWKGDTDELDDDQKGPLGGRIMWFPPYGLTFNENASVNWSETEFIGRGEKIPTYINTTRGGTLSFDILVDHPSVINMFNDKGIGGEGIGDVDDTGSYEQTLLRWFAGCEILSSNSGQDADEEEEQQTIVNQPIEIETPEATEKSFAFFLFFPNNYSGVDDIKKKYGNGFPIDYLVNGYGAQVGYESEIKQANLINPVSIDELRGDAATAWGYEMTPEVGLSGGQGIETPEEFNIANSYMVGENQNIIMQAYQSKTQKWAYRVDSAYENQILGKKNYVDNMSYQLNTIVGYTKALDAYSIPSNERETYFDFASVFVALACNGDLSLANNKYHLLDKYSTESINKIFTILNYIKKNQCKVRVEVNGYASNHGYSKLNTTLARNRKESIQKWMEGHPVFKNASFITGTNAPAPKTQSKSVNDLNAKLGRAARVVVYYTVEQVVQTVVPEPSSIGPSNINLADNEMQTRMDNSESQFVSEITSIKDLTQDAIAIKNVITGATSDPNALNCLTALEEVGRLQDAMRETINASKITDNTIQASGGKNGYGNEYQFFSELDKSDSILHSKITQKFKFFDPAYHSITPEGFQSRLTFLHQCTRQGRTLEWSGDNAGRTAANLAFGRPPILVLRIGDFYNTKIVITSLSIDYKNSSGISWDLNDEGIGIMPMYAHININFNFHGGSELGGPIPRLQNAVSFNYYANTSVYDNRAEMVDYADDGSGKPSKYKINDKL